MDPSDYAVVACLLLCAVARLCTRESFCSRIVVIIDKHPSNTYCKMFRFALKRDSSHSSTWSVRASGRCQEFIPINKQLLRSYVDCCSMFGLVLARPSPNKLICLLTVFSFVVKWRQNYHIASWNQWSYDSRRYECNFCNRAWKPEKRICMCLTEFVFMQVSVCDRS